MKIMRQLPSFIFSSLLSALGISAGAQGMVPDDSAFVGVYRSGGVDSVTELSILKDHTFCYMFMGGALDMLVAGHWERSDLNKGQLVLQEHRPVREIYLAYASLLGRPGAQVEFNFDGYGLSNARAPVFAMSGSDAQPTTFRPLFHPDKSEWSANYVLPVADRAGARFMYIGDMETDANQQAKRLRVSQYALGNFDSVGFGFDPQQARPPLKMLASLRGSELYINGQRFATKKPLSPDMEAEIHANCIAPAFADPAKPLGHLAASAQHGDANQDQWLRPIRSFYLDPKTVQGVPIFDKNYKSPDLSANDALWQTENTQLLAAYEAAVGDASKLDAFLQITHNIAQQPKRIHQHAPILVQRFAELMVKKNSAGDLASAQKMLHHFTDTIHPHTQAIQNEAAQYATSVIASQGFVIAAAKNDAALGDLVLNQLLGHGADFSQHKNATMLYNMACYHAQQNQKAPMLKAITLARAKGKPAQQFLDDTDFKAFWKDAEFVRALR
jgi:hypothetical protein